jgi:uncharacterized protein DUF6527
MLSGARLQHEFVEYIPTELKDGIVYVSIPFATAVHKCACGCGLEVVTPLSPTDWRVIFDGQTVSFQPSIGNWSFPCQSHYWITRNRVQWAPRMSSREIEAGRRWDRWAKERYFDQDEALQVVEPRVEPVEPQVGESFWRRLKRRLFSAK